MSDTSVQRQVERAAQVDTFKSIALEWLGKQHFTPKTRKKAQWTFNDLLFPNIGSRPISSIKAPDVVGGGRKTAGRAVRDPTADLRGALAPIQVTNRAALTDPKRVGELLRAIDGYSAQSSTEYARKLAPL